MHQTNMKIIQKKTFFFLINFFFQKIVPSLEGLGSHCVKSVRIRSFSGPYFPAFRMNTGEKNKNKIIIFGRIFVLFDKNLLA